MSYAACTIRIIIHRILKILCVIYTRSNHNVSTIRSKVLNCLAFGYNICYLACKITHTMTYVHAIRPNAILKKFATICAMAYRPSFTNSLFSLTLVSVQSFDLISYRYFHVIHFVSRSLRFQDRRNPMISHIGGVYCTLHTQFHNFLLDLIHLNILNYVLFFDSEILNKFKIDFELWIWTVQLAHIVIVRMFVFQM